MTKDSNVAYNHFAHLNKFLKNQKTIEHKQLQKMKINGCLTLQNQIFIKIKIKSKAKRTY